MRYPATTDNPFDRSINLDPDGMAALQVKVRFNRWEHAQLRRLAQRDCGTLQRTIRTIVRAHLFAEQKR